MKFTIGEFSRICRLSIKSLRLYHEKGILIPSEVDNFNGYRYYNEINYDTAMSIRILKDFDFTLAEIKEIIDQCDDETLIIDQLQEKLLEIQGKIHRYREISASIDSIIKIEKESKMTELNSFEIEEKTLDTTLIAGYRMKGKYDEIGKGFSVLYKKMGRHINGKPMSLYFDDEYKEENADFEACVPVRKGKDEENISVRELKGGKCVSLIHQGPYDTLSNSYKKIFNYINEKGYKSVIPTREIYLKGPGMIFKGNPKNYLTEIQFLIEE